MAKGRTKEETGKGHSQRRTVSEISFHSLRHTATSLLKNAGVSAAVAMDIIGHESEAINRHYTHIEAATKRAALRKLPKLL
jgi:integrase